MAFVHVLSSTTPSDREVSAEPSPHVPPKYRLLEDADGSFVAEDVDDGDYLLSVWCIVPPVSNGLPRRVLGRAKIPFAVPADPATGVKDLGQVQLQPIL